ncbi:MAG: alginate export family protein [Pirellula sp.]|nr:alginate export family protein [Pirellula sp.]
MMFLFFRKQASSYCRRLIFGVLLVQANFILAQVPSDNGISSVPADYPQQAYSEVTDSNVQIPSVDRSLEDTEKQSAEKMAKLNKSMKDAYKGVFYLNDFSYLRNPVYQGPHFAGDSFKGLNDGKLDLGGEYRSRYHHENNMRGIGLTGIDDQFWLSRVRLFSNYRVTENVRVYGEYLYADSGGETFAPRTIEENRGEAQNLFVDATLFDANNVQLVGRAGRQELLFGAERLVSPLDWANTRRTFDGYRATLRGASNTLDLFYTNPVNRIAATGGTNEWDSSNNNQSFYGAYLSNQSLGSDYGVSALETYYIGYDNTVQNFSFHTLGSRIAGKSDSTLYELEGGVQFGSNADSTRHDAGFLAAGLGKVLNAGGSWSPTVWAWYDWASGGDANFVTPGDDSFHHYFPLAHKYNGFMDLFGRRNLNDVNMQFISPIGSRVNFLVWYHYFFLDQATTPYSIVMSPYNAGNAAVSKDLGHEIDLLWTITINPRHNLMVGYSHFNSGDYFDTPGVAFSGDADFFYSQYQVRF